MVDLYNEAIIRQSKCTWRSTNLTRRDEEFRNHFTGARELASMKGPKSLRWLTEADVLYSCASCWVYSVEKIMASVGMLPVAFSASSRVCLSAGFLISSPLSAPTLLVRCSLPTSLGALPTLCSGSHRGAACSLVP